MSRPLTHDSRVSFPIASAIRQAAEGKARAQGMSFAEYLRHLVRRDALESVN
jgi:predicted DNA binding CopG/RHH family protein